MTEMSDLCYLRKSRLSDSVNSVTIENMLPLSSHSKMASCFWCVHCGHGNMSFRKENTFPKINCHDLAIKCS